MDILELTDSTGWDDRIKYDFEIVKAIVDRIEQDKVDITGQLGSDWTKIGCVLGRFGEAGRSLFVRISQINKNYSVENTETKFTWCIENTKLKSLSAFFLICKAHSIDTSAPNLENVDPKIFIPKEADPQSGNDYEDYGFFQMKNRYYKLMPSDKGYKPQPFSNFVMKVKFHISDQKHPRRIIQLTNNAGKSITVDTPTNNLGSVQKFIDFVEGLGNFHFDGMKTDLTRLKRKLFDQEKPCMQIDTMGWQSDGFYAFCNGIFECETKTFTDADDDGIVEHGKKNFYLPAGNKAYANDRFLFSNEKKFKHFKNHKVSFEEWSSRFYKVFGNFGAIAMTFGIACIFSDVVFGTMEGYPILFLYGEGSSGKGSLSNNVRRLTGIPQDPLKLSEKANTDKAKIREMAQFVNGITGLEEYTNELDMKAINTLKGIWDRFGYKRAIMDSKFGNESVPINSGVIMTGNEYPSDDALLQRLVVLEINENSFDQTAKDHYNDFKKWVELGITTVTCELLEHRKVFEENFRATFQKEYKEMVKMVGLMNVTDRMINNIAAISATYQVLSTELKFPFNYDLLTGFLAKCMDRQSNKRSTGGLVQQFWDTLQYLVNRGEVKHTKEFKITDDTVSIRFKEIYPLYAMALARMRVNAPHASTLLDKLKLSQAFVGNKDSARFGTEKSSCHEFSYKLIGVDLWHAINHRTLEEEERKKLFRQPGLPYADDTNEIELPAGVSGPVKADTPF